MSSFNYDADAELAQALAALKEARWHLSRANFALQQCALKTADPARTVVLAGDAGSLSMLATTMSHVATSAGDSESGAITHALTRGGTV